VELKHLKSTERPEIIQAISVAGDHGDLSENAAEYQLPPREAGLHWRAAISELELKLSLAQVIVHQT